MLMDCPCCGLSMSVSCGNCCCCCCVRSALYQAAVDCCTNHMLDLARCIGVCSRIGVVIVRNATISRDVALLPTLVACAVRCVAFSFSFVGLRRSFSFAFCACVVGLLVDVALKPPARIALSDGGFSFAKCLAVVVCAAAFDVFPLPFAFLFVCLRWPLPFHVAPMSIGVGPPSSRLSGG